MRLVGNWGVAMFTGLRGKQWASGRSTSAALSARFRTAPGRHPVEISLRPPRVGRLPGIARCSPERDSLPGPRLVDRPPEPGHVPPGPRADAGGFCQDGLHRHHRHPDERYLLVLGCRPPGSFLSGALRPAQHRRQPGLPAPAGHRTPGGREIHPMDLQGAWRASGPGRFLPVRR